MNNLKKEHNQTHPSLLLGVFCCEKHKAQSVSYSKGKHYPELYDIKEQIAKDKNGPHNRPYSANKHKVSLYRALFFSFGLFFITLAGLIHFKTTNWSCSMFFSNCMMVKTLICTLSIFFSLSAFFIGLTMSTEKEAINHLYRRALLRLAKVYHRKKIEYGLGLFFALGKKYHKAAALKQYYEEARDKVKNQRTESLLLIERIKSRRENDAVAKEDLFNQVILELHDQLHDIIQTFQDTAI